LSNNVLCSASASLEEKMLKEPDVPMGKRSAQDITCGEILKRKLSNWPEEDLRYTKP
jgi:hypothetical protein